MLRRRSLPVKGSKKQRFAGLTRSSDSSKNMPVPAISTTPILMETAMPTMTSTLTISPPIAVKTTNLHHLPPKSPLLVLIAQPPVLHAAQAALSSSNNFYLRLILRPNVCATKKGQTAHSRAPNFLPWLSNSVTPMLHSTLAARSLTRPATFFTM